MLSTGKFASMNEDKKQFDDTKGDNTNRKLKRDRQYYMAKEKGQIMIYNTLHRKTNH